jgi:hypothetical protein
MAKAAPASDDPKQSRLRSPNYPAVSLPEAVARVGALIEKDGKAGAPPDAAAKHIGFSGAHGTARTVLSALKKFGLTTEQRGRVVPTQLAIDIVNFPSDSPRSKAAKQTAVLGPLIYKQLVDRYEDAGNMPSPESLRPELIADMGFNPKAVDAFIKDFYVSLEYAGLLDGNKLLLSGEPSSGSPPADSEVEYRGAGPAPHRPIQPPTGRLSNTADQAMRELTLPLMDDAVAYMRLPVRLSEENYDYLLQQMSIMRRGLVAKKGPSLVDSGTIGQDDSNRAGVAFMVTNDMRRKLLELGFTPGAISEMTPQQAWIKISHAEGLAFDTDPEN